MLVVVAGGRCDGIHGSRGPKPDSIPAHCLTVGISGTTLGPLAGHARMPEDSGNYVVNS